MDFERLNRVTYGPTEKSLKELKSKGWKAWVAEQLRPRGADPEVDKRVKHFSMEVEHDGKKRKVTFDSYFKSAKELWQATASKPIDRFEASRPFKEAIAYTWLKQMYSKWQLNEILVEFWHNHFNVSGEADNIIELLFPVYDREVIRKHAFGNFRVFLEATAKSPCMLYYLDNVHSKASPANENYAREIMELHTMGEDAYVNHLYKSWKDVPGALEGKAEGFIDEDIYEIARAFTGWTVGNRKLHNKRKSGPATGAFYYNERWHDNYQKRIFGKEFPSHRGAMQDGLDVLDMVAFHPATSKFLCTKLCRWLVADNPPESLINKAVDVWKSNERADDQLLKVVETILLSKEFEANLGSKIKRPNILMTSFMRAIGMDFMPFPDFHWNLSQMGYKQYNWGPPTGHPDDTDYWVNSDMLLKRWNTLGDAIYADHAYDNVQLNLPEQTPTGLEMNGVIQFWAKRMLGKELNNEQIKPLEKAWWHDIDWEVSVELIRVQHPDSYNHKLRQLVALLACSPEFQKR